MGKLEEIRERLEVCDKQIVSVLEDRMDIIKEIMEYKKENGLPILQPEQEKRQRKMLKEHVKENTYKEEILDIFTYIVENSRRIQARTLFTHNIFLIGFMGVGKSTVSDYLSIVSCGGGVAMREINVREMKKNGRVVLLTASPETILERVKDSDERPLLRGRKNTEYISELMEIRRPKYRAAADIIVDTDHKNVEEIAEEIVGKLTHL